MSSKGTPRSSATIWANVVAWPWPCGEVPAITCTFPVAVRRIVAASHPPPRAAPPAPRRGGGGRLGPPPPGVRGGGGGGGNPRGKVALEGPPAITAAVDECPEEWGPGGDDHEVGPHVHQDVEPEPADLA